MGTVMVVAADVSAALNGPSRPQVKNPTQNRTAHVEKQPAWRLNPVQGKTRNTVHVAVNEYVRAVQYDRDDTPDICEVYGSLHCKADTDGVPECVLGVTSASGIDSVVTHACVQSIEPNGHTNTVNHTHKLRFVPPTSQFELCAYKMCATSIRLPLRGFFQMKTIRKQTVRLLIQLKLDDEVPNNFDFCEVVLPLRRGKIVSVDAQPTSGAMSLSGGGHGLTWTLGQKWKTREVACPATVRFSDDEEPIDRADRFLTGDNAVLDVRFKVADFTLSRCKVDTTMFGSSLPSSSRVKLSTSRQFLSTNYTIWNSLGKSRRCLHPEKMAG
eukprot:m.1512200 g.1512200  ORF g.1512200 m.1512200 type:complete len:327 (+) comp25213_c0_seq5:1216-2196(+)